MPQATPFFREASGWLIELTIFWPIVREKMYCILDFQTTRIPKKNWKQGIFCIFNSGELQKVFMGLIIMKNQ